ncbi:MAG TPA: hypothetical protein VHC97_23800 [Thermoanaerobaculia bacterium]|jgi:hypothetical protein|nr:hypothetical protein [Thermoanaerobaculia bacterium]
MKLQGVAMSSVAGWLLLASPGLQGAIHPEPLAAGASALEWAGPQFVQANRAGNVFFLRGDTLEVYPLNKSGVFGEPVRLQSTEVAPGLVHSAVLSPDGDQWLVYTDFSVRRFVDGKEKFLPELEWNPWAVAFLRDSPVIAVIPRSLRRSRKQEKLVDVPWFLKLAGDKWSSMADLDRESLAKLRQNGALNDAIAENAVFLTGDREGKLWAARQYAYHVQRFSPGGRLLLDITVDGGTVKKKKESKGIEIKLHGEGDNPTEATRNPRSETATYFPFTAEPVLLSLAAGRDGCLYLLVRTAEGGMALDRYDPVRSVLERVPLTLKASGMFTTAAGRDALYLASWQGKDGRWRISWDTLEQARWKAVENAEVQGLKVDAAGD